MFRRRRVETAPSRNSCSGERATVTASECASGVPLDGHGPARTSAPFFAPITRERPLVRSSSWRALFLAFVVLCPTKVRGQDTSFLQRLGLDRLQFVSLGAELGRVVPSQIVPAQIYSVTTDYGELARNWRAVFDVSFWESQYTDAAVGTFVDSLRRSVVDPTNDFSISQSRVQVYDVIFSAGARWQSSSAVALRPFIGGGLAVHIMNAEGRLINGTFMERALDNISTGLF